MVAVYRHHILVLYIVIGDSAPKIFFGGVVDMDETIEAVLDLPKYVSNLKLPDPTLRQYYIDLQNREYWLTEEIDSGLVEFNRMIMDCNKEDMGKPVEERKPIKLFIYSVGGDVQILLTTINLMKLSKTPVYTINACTAYSAAADLVVAGSKRFALKGTHFMVHSGSCSFSGNTDQVDSTKKYFDKVGNKLVELFVSCTNVDKKLYKRKTVTDWFFDEEEALKLGVIDEVVDDLDSIL